MPRSPAPSGLLACLLLTLCAGPAPALAQAPAELLRQGFKPVEQGVDDVDPLAGGLRHLYSGIGFAGQDSRVFQRGEGPDQRFYLVTPQFTASFDRAEYLTALLDRHGTTVTFMVVPPNTIFHIGLPEPPAASREVPTSDHPARVDARMSPDFAFTPKADDESPDADDRASAQEADDARWALYRRASEAHQRDVFDALDRALDLSAID